MESGTGSYHPNQGTAEEGPSPDSTEPPPATISRHGEGSSSAAGEVAPLSRYESQKRRDWNTFLQYLKNHKPPLSLARCSGAHVIEFLKYLDQFGKTKVHATGCPYFGHPNPPGPCACPLKQAWGSLDALVGRLRAAYEENSGRSETNPFGAKAVRIYLREVKGEQAKARGIPYEKKKKRKRPNVSGWSSSAAAEGTSHQEGSIGEGGRGGDGGESVGGDTLSERGSHKLTSSFNVVVKGQGHDP